MSPVPMLHEFVSNLLSDQSALAAFDQDPQGSLDAAGMSDVAPQDVTDMLPLMADAAPVSRADGLGSLAAAGDPAGTLDGAVSPLVTDVARVGAGVAGQLPDASGVFGTLSNVADGTGVNRVEDGTLHTGSGLVHGVAEGVRSVPVLGPVAGAEDVDLRNTAEAVHGHVADGYIVGATVDAATNHLGDAMLTPVAVHTAGALPAVGGPLGNLADQGTHQVGGVSGIGNEHLGSTPVGVHSGPVLADQFLGRDDMPGALDHASSALPVHAPAAVPTDVAGTVTGAAGNLPVHAPAMGQTPLASLSDSGMSAGHSPLSGVSLPETSGLDLHDATGALDHLPLGH